MIKILIKSIREYKKEAILTPIFVALETIMEVIIPFLMALLLDKGISVGNMKNVYIIGLLLIVCAFFSLAFGFASGIFGGKASSGFSKNLRKDMYYKVQDFSFYNIDKFSPSSIVTRLTTDVTNVQMAFQMIIRVAVRAPLMMIFSLIMAFSINSKVSLIFLGIVPVLGVGLFLITTKARPVFTKLFKRYDVFNNTVEENVRGVRVVKSFVEEENEISKFKNESKVIYDISSKAERIVALNNPLMMICMYTCMLLISFFGSKFIISGAMTTGELTGLLSYATSILMSLMMLSFIYVMCIMAVSSAKRCVEILTETPDIKSKNNPKYEMKDGSIVFDNVDFSYENDKEKLSLKNININIKSGETIGIIGSTGSSKSTLVSLIPRLYDTTSGNILIGGVNVKDYEIKTLRDNVSMVLQKNVLFSGTIKDNLKWGNENATDEKLINACKLSNAHEFINELKDKYDTVLDQGATNLSGGQKQRICIARALLKNPKILILDDSTSACDMATDAKIRKAFNEEIASCTKIIIAQRIASVENADRVIVMENGTINAFDTPKNLLKNNNIYKEIYDLQTGGKA